MSWKVWLHLRSHKRGQLSSDRWKYNIFSLPNQSLVQMMLQGDNEQAVLQLQKKRWNYAGTLKFTFNLVIIQNVTNFIQPCVLVMTFDSFPFFVFQIIPSIGFQLRTIFFIIKIYGTLTIPFGKAGKFYKEMKKRGLVSIFNFKWQFFGKFLIYVNKMKGARLV